ncbi:MAG: hypothetical protein HFP77_09645 [Methylococcales symbiont of Iophon sp. n. MRB-2018]|nr:MAG: hypothetical protein HFP77_09645 [Methylococcales symbiont of Iophon sp. n. MRB-2018]KAF3978817.1 MAG: hypothetical protein HFP76_09980 [Methylococcales symbiont of Iophon sp. n. MRB-2018]
MTAVAEPLKINITDYLAAEQAGDTKPEYGNGDVYAMAGSRQEVWLCLPSKKVLIPLD